MNIKHEFGLRSFCNRKEYLKKQIGEHVRVDIIVIECCCCCCCLPAHIISALCIGYPINGMHFLNETEKHRLTHKSMKIAWNLECIRHNYEAEQGKEKYSIKTRSKRIISNRTSHTQTENRTQFITHKQWDIWLLHWIFKLHFTACQANIFHFSPCNIAIESEGFVVGSFDTEFKNFLCTPFF